MLYRAKIVVSPKRGISDPEGDTLLNRLRGKGYKEAERVRSGKYWEVEFEANSREEAISWVTKIYTNPPLLNPVKDKAELIELEEVK